MFYAVIPAGGSGTRLWPLSRAGHPKFLHALTGSEASLLQATLSRLAPLCAPEQVFVVTGAAHAASVARQAPSLPESNVLIEPSPRDSCAAIGLAAAVIAARDPDGVMGVFSADHLIGDAGAFIEAVRAAIGGAREGYLMTVGITPDRPETGYGYLRCGDQHGAGPVRSVLEFREKPSYDQAVSYVESGRYLWNAGMFVWRPTEFLAQLRRQEPELHAGLAEIGSAWGTPRQDEVLGEVWPRLKKISVDYAVMEGAAAAGRVAAVPADIGWTDIGDFHTLGDVLPGDGAGNVVVDAGGDDKPGVLLRDTTGTVLVPHSGRMIAALGVRDLVIVDTPDVVLVCPRDRAQDVKKLVEELKERGETDLI